MNWSALSGHLRSSAVTTRTTERPVYEPAVFPTAQTTDDVDVPPTPQRRDAITAACERLFDLGVKR